MRAALAAVAILLPSVAAAQTTTCGWELGKWVCRAQQQQQRPDFGRAYQDAYDRTTAQFQAQQAARAQADAQRAQAEAQSEAQRHEAHVQGVHQLVADAIREHRCADAKDIALQDGDLTLADQAQRLCTPAN